jgi:hypothetical protein
VDPDPGRQKWHPKRKGKIENSWYEELDIISEGLEDFPAALEGLHGGQNYNIPNCIFVSPTVDCLHFLPHPGSTHRIRIQNPVKRIKKRNKQKKEKEKEVLMIPRKMCGIPVPK